MDRPISTPLGRRTVLALLVAAVAAVSAQQPGPAREEAVMVTAHGRIAAFGSSTIARSGPRLAAAFPGMPFHNGGKGGEVAEETLARLGSRPVRVDAVTLPGSGTVIVRDAAFAGALRSMAPFTGVLAGVRGTLAAHDGAAGTFTFTRAEAGAPVEVPHSTPVRPDHGQRGGLLILNLGKNNLTGAGGTRDVPTLLRWTREAVVFNAEGRTVVLGHFVNTGVPRTGSAQRNGVEAYNAAAAAAFGDRFLDLGGFLTSSEVWEYAGLLPTAEDRREQAAGNKPPSLSMDRGHLNVAGEAAVARRLREHLDALGWLESRG